MAYESPASTLFNTAGIAHAVLDGVAIPASTPSLLVAGSDGTNARHLSTDTNGKLNVNTQSGGAASSAVTSVLASVTSTTVLAANAAREGAAVYNDSSSALYLKLGATASSTSFTVKMGANSYFEVLGGYTGVIDGIWDTATGSARVTEITT
jgi:hypothetical protein